MARYRAKAKTFVNDTLVEEGQEFTSDKEPGESWHPLDDAAREAVDAAELRRASKAQAIAAGVATAGNEELVKLVREQIDTVAALTQRVAALETNAVPDVSDFVRSRDLAALDERVGTARTDIDELDAGLQIIDGRLSDVEGVLAALEQSGVKPAEQPSEPPPPPPEPTPEPEPEPAPEPTVEEPPADEPPAEETKPEPS